MNTNLVIITPHQCPIHGVHGQWIKASLTNGRILLTSQICGWCAIAVLRQVGFTITEPDHEALKENGEDWVLSELPEKKI